MHYSEDNPIRHWKYILDSAGNPIPCDDILTWAKWFENTENRILQRDELPNGVCVSTVFLGMDHNYCFEGPPILWETMIFGGEHDSYQDRYNSREAALEGHKQALTLAQILTQK
jgi:hypothetical protein